MMSRSAQPIYMVSGESVRSISNFLKDFIINVYIDFVINLIRVIMEIMRKCARNTSSQRDFIFHSS